MSLAGGGGGYYPTPPPFPFSFHLLEVTVVSAQDLFANSRSMRTYAVAWIDPAHKLRTRLDAAGHSEPTWNDKFVFRVDDAVLRSDTAAVTVNIYAARPRFLPASDILVGTARALLSSLRPSVVTRFVAVQVRRPQSLRPQGILNIGVSLLDAYVRSLPIFAELATAGGPSAVVCSKAPKNKKTRPIVDRDGAAVESKLGRSPALDKERVVLEAKLAQWRSELRSVSRRERAAMAESKGRSELELPPPPPPPDREGAAVESKLEKWREELPAVADGEEKEKGSDGGGGERRVQRRRSIGRLACFAGGGEGELELQGDKTGDAQAQPTPKYQPQPVPPPLYRRTSRLRPPPSPSPLRRERKASPPPPPPPALPHMDHR